MGKGIGAKYVNYLTSLIKLNWPHLLNTIQLVNPGNSNSPAWKNIARSDSKSNTARDFPA